MPTLVGVAKKMTQKKLYKGDLWNRKYGAAENHCALGWIMREHGFANRELEVALDKKDPRREQLASFTTRFVRKLLRTKDFPSDDETAISVLVDLNDCGVSHNSFRKAYETYANKKLPDGINDLGDLIKLRFRLDN